MFSCVCCLNPRVIVPVYVCEICGAAVRNYVEYGPQLENPTGLISGGVDMVE